MITFSTALFAATLHLATLPTVAVDAGHGGEKDGAPGICGLLEKDLTLVLAREVKELLNASGKAKAVLTRNSDTDLSLDERAKIANRAGATLFVSIHANSSTNPKIHGVETFFLSRRVTSRRLRALALQENDGMSLEVEEEKDALAAILSGLTLNANHGESQRLSLRLQEKLNFVAHASARGVLQAPFIVLSRANMAAALVEVGFLTNPTECAALKEPTYQQKLAEALSTAIIAHLGADSAYMERPDQAVR